MTHVSMSGVGVDFGATTILRDVTFTVARGERWGIVGRNGAGKTTLFRLITGALEPTSGAVARSPGLRITMLDQHRDFGDAASVWEAAAVGYRDLIKLEHAMAQQAERLAELGERASPADLERYGRDQERFAHGGGYDYHARVDAVLQGLGFDAEESKSRPLSELSGGERGRVGLAAPLAAPADLVLLDEPTNHLDLETTSWLTGYLAEFGETVIVISHDRAFLDDTVDHVLHVSGGTTAAYRGGYSSFVTQRAERELTAQRTLDKQRAFIAKEEDYIRRNIAGQNTAQAKGRRKRLDRLPRLSPPPGEAGAMTINLEIHERGGDRVVQTDKLVVAAGDRTLIRNATVTALRTDVVALVGPNGAGKTTLLATLLGDRAPAGGTVKIGASITPAWYRQDLAGVPLGGTIYEVIQDLRPLWTRGQIQGHLGAFGFSGDEVQRLTTTLSGGERARVALAMIALSWANLLVLDEPTNHLDVESIEALEDAIEEYEGTVILVSHDRAFLRELSTRVWSIVDERLEEFTGPFVEWEADQKKRARERQAAASAAAAINRATAARIAAKRVDTSAKDAGAERRSAMKAAQAAESAALSAESDVRALEAELADPSLYDGTGESARRAGDLKRRLEAARATHDAKVAAWAEAAERVEGLTGG